MMGRFLSEFEDTFFIYRIFC